MPERRRCDCGQEYWWPGQRWQHEKCAINAAINTPEIRLGADEGTTPPVALAAGPSSPAPRTANRRDRAVYNEYMRAYMKAYRARG